MLPILVSILMVANVAVLNSHAETNEKLEVQRSMTIKEKNAAEAASKRVTELSEQKTGIESSLKEERLKTENLQQENESLKANLQAKKEREAQAAQLAVQETQVAQKAEQPAPTVQVSGDKQSWLAASGIPQSEWGYVDSIVTRESGWIYNVWNSTGSGAYGLCQSLPASKMASAGSDYMSNPVTQLKWCHGYAIARYGGWSGAYAFWQNNHWW